MVIRVPVTQTTRTVDYKSGYLHSPDPQIKNKTVRTATTVISRGTFNTNVLSR